VVVVVWWWWCGGGGMGKKRASGASDSRGVKTKGRVVSRYKTPSGDGALIVLPSGLNATRTEQWIRKLIAGSMMDLSACKVWNEQCAVNFANQMVSEVQMRGGDGQKEALVTILVDAIPPASITRRLIDDVGSVLLRAFMENLTLQRMMKMTL
jgi:hypothetical protein